MLTPPPFFVVFPSEERLLLAASQDLSSDELEALQMLASLKFPPITSLQSLALIFGFSPSLLGGMVRNSARYYRKFEIQSGRRTRQIHTPKVALKLIQSWFGHHLSRAVVLSDLVHGFVPKRSIVTAARTHCPARWVFSLDIRNFFGSVTAERVFECLCRLKYSREAAHLMTDLCTMRLDGGHRGLPQGAPSSPVLANLAFCETDKKLEQYANNDGLKISRYADDVSVSGRTTSNPRCLREIQDIIEGDGWVIAENKTRLAEFPRHSPQVLGLLVDELVPRLPKRYRNRIRMMRFMLNTEYLTEKQRAIFAGHVAYAESIR